MVLERVVVAHLGAEVTGEGGCLSGRAGLVGRQDAGRAGLGVTAAAGREDDRAGVEPVDVVAAVKRRGEVAVGALEAGQRGVVVDGDAAAVELGPQRLGDGVAGAVADLQQPRHTGPTAAGEPVAALVAREFDADGLEPADRLRCLGGQHRDELGVGGAVRRGEDILRVPLGRILRVNCRLDTAVGHARVAGRARSLGHQGHLGARAGGRPRGCQTGAATADHEHVRTHGKPIHGSHGTQARLIGKIRSAYIDQLYGIGRGFTRAPRQHQRIVSIAGDDVHVVVKDRLPGRRAV
jgi:hypothetical protein